MWYQTGRKVVCGMTQGDKVTRWFYEQAESRRLTGTAQRLWHVLYHLLGTAHANRFYAVRSRQLAARMGVCLKSVERGRKRSSYRRQYDNDRAYSANGKSHPRHKFKQEGRDLSFLEK